MQADCIDVSCWIFDAGSILVGCLVGWQQQSSFSYSMASVVCSREGELRQQGAESATSEQCAAQKRSESDGCMQHAWIVILNSAPVAWHGADAANYAEYTKCRANYHLNSLVDKLSFS